MNLFRSVIFILTFLSLSAVQARYGLPSEAGIECIKNETSIVVNADGTYKIIVDEQIKILNENARQNFSVQTLHFDKLFANLKILEAKTILDGKEYPLTKEKIEIKPLASDPTGLSETYQVLIPFENAVIGSILHLRYEQDVFKTQVPNFFETVLSYTNGYHWKDSNITITSALPLNVQVNDPKKHLDFKHEKSGANEVYKIRLIKPFLECIVHETDNNSLEPEKQTYIFASTEDPHHQRISKISGEVYEKIIKAPLPKQLEKMVEKAKKLKTENEQITSVISDLIETIHYLGTWKGDGNLYPRTLDTIVKSGYGDCKEYSTCLVATLRALGFDANVAFVNRGELYLHNKKGVPLREYNHTIVNMKGKTGKTIWLDPTNMTAMADGIYPDIADRPALVLHPEKPTKENIPPVDYRHSVKVVKETRKFKGSETVVKKGSLKLSGECSIHPKEATILHSDSIVKEGTLKSLSETNDPKNVKINIINEKNRIIKDLEVHYAFEEESTLQTTNLGFAVQTTSPWATPYLEASTTHEGALFIDTPNTTHFELVLEGVTADKIDALAYSIKSPWINAKRDLIQKEDGIHIIGTVEILKSVITPEEMRSPEFEKLKKTLRKYCANVALIVKMK